MTTNEDMDAENNKAMQRKSTIRKSPQKHGESLYQQSL